jgi:hypothetical protein
VCPSSLRVIPFAYNWLRVFRNAEASRCGHGILQARQTKAVW